MPKFNEFHYRNSLSKKAKTLLLEHEIYRSIPGTRNSYRQDAGNTSTFTDQHSHIFAHPKGKGKEIYAVNKNGTGHDGFSGSLISAAHADFFRSHGYNIPTTNILECISFSQLDASSNEYSLTLLVDTPDSGFKSLERLLKKIDESLSS